MQIRTPRELGAVIREHRKRLGLDQASLARAVGVSRQWVVGIEAGKARAELTLVLRTLDALGLRIDVSDGEVRATPAARSRRGAVEVPDIDAVVESARRPGPRT